MAQDISLSFTEKPPQDVVFVKSDSPFGAILVGMTPDLIVCRLSFLIKASQKSILESWQKAWPKTLFTKGNDKHQKSAARLFNPRVKTIDLLLTGTPFQHRVWAELMTVPQGFVISYKDLGARLGKENAARAIGQAMGANPIPLLIPCHRVIKQDGSLGGFSSGTAIKKKLLESELASA